MILALGFERAAAARDALHAVRDQTTIRAAVLVTRSRRGWAHAIAGNPLAVAAAIPSSLVGGLIGAVVYGPIGFLIGGAAAGVTGALVARRLTGFPRPMMEQLRGRVAPGTSVLAVELDDPAAAAALTELVRSGGGRVLRVLQP
jgi:uncharacterized membrane protein